MAARARRDDPAIRARSAQQRACRRRGNAHRHGTARAGARPSRVRPLLPAREPRRAAPPPAPAARGRARRPHLAGVARRCVQPARRVPADELATRAAGTSIQLVLTAHPTETTRRSVLLSHIRIEAELVVLDDARVSPAERREAEERIAEEVTLLWQTDEVRHDRLRVSDEIRHALWFFEHSLISAATDLFHAVARAAAGRAEPALVRLLGRRRHGRQPAAGPASIEEALARARALALGRYRDEVRSLAVEIAASRSLVAVSGELDRSLQRDEQELPWYAAEIGSRNELEPYRRKLSFMWWRLGNDGYASAADLLDDLRLIRRSLAANGGAPRRRRTRGAARADGRALRLPRGEARHPPACARAVEPTRTRRSRGCRDRAQANVGQHGSARHADRLRHDLGRRRRSRPRADDGAAVDRAAVRDRRRPRSRAGDSRRAPRR